MLAVLRRVAGVPWFPHASLGAAAAALFSIGLATHPSGRDEAVSVLAARHPVPELLGLIVNHEPHPAGYYLALTLWPHDTLVEVRLFSFLPAVLCVPVIFAIARRLGLPAWRAGILAATSPFLGFYSVEARMYSWLGFMGALALLITASMTESEKPPLPPPESPAVAGIPDLRFAILAGFVMAVAAYVHYFALFLGLTVVLWLLVRRLHLHALVATATAAVLYIPGLVMLAEQVPLFRRYPTGTWQAKEDPSHVFQAFSVLLAGAESYIPAFIATGVLLAVIGFALYRGRSRPAVRMLGFWLLPTLALPLAIGAVVPLDSPRYLAAAFPALLLLLAAATAEVRPHVAVVVTTMLAVLGAGLVIDSTYRADNTKPPIPAVLALAGPDRLVVAQHVWLAPEIAVYEISAIAYDFNPPTIDRSGLWALPAGADYPPAATRPLLIINYCGRFRPPPAGYTIERKVTFDMNVCGELINPP